MYKRYINIIIIIIIVDLLDSASLVVTAMVLQDVAR